MAKLIYTDGSCVGNGKPNVKGGWAFYLHDDKTVFYGGIENATNNIAELTAVIKALKYVLDHEGNFVIYSDSEYAIKSITLWIKGWKKNGWKTSAKTPVKNKDLICQIDDLLQKIGVRVSFQHVNGHSGDENNDIADIYANFGRKCGEELELMKILD